MLGEMRGVMFFFFQAEDGIRDTSVTGVQTCALPILSVVQVKFPSKKVRTTPYSVAVRVSMLRSSRDRQVLPFVKRFFAPPAPARLPVSRSEERRVGKESRSRRSPDSDEQNEHSPEHA